MFSAITVKKKQYIYVLFREYKFYSGVWFKRPNQILALVNISYSHKTGLTPPLFIEVRVPC